MEGDKHMKLCAKCKKTPRICGSYCRPCYREVDRRRYYKHHDKRLEERRQNYKKMSPTEKQNKFLLSLNRNPEKWKARQVLRNAVTKGTVKREPCEKCGKLPVHGHHTDYSKPFDVMWLCVKHHYEQHRKYDDIKSLIKERV